MNLIEVISPSRAEWDEIIYYRAKSVKQEALLRFSEHTK